MVGVVLRDFTRFPVAEQAQLKSRLQEVVDRAIASLEAAGRIVLEAPDRLVVMVLDNPEQALVAAQRVQAFAADLPLCVGLNHGPFKLVADPSGAPEFVGDGILGVITLANLATRGRLLISRSFREALAAEAPHRAGALSPAGSFTDDSVRKHELFTLDPQAAAVRRRWLLAMGALALAVGVGAGIAGRMTRARRPALLRFDVRPRGDILIDGQSKGSTPPLTTLEVPPGRHTVEVRNFPYPPLRLEMNLKPAEEVKVSHAFPGARTERREGDSFVEEIRRRLGI